MRKMKKLVILVLACLCVMACALGFASCEDETSNQSVGLSFVINEDGESYSVRGIGVCEERDIVIPATYKNKPVTGIEPLCFQRSTSINSVTIPNSVTTIGDGAFQECIGLKSVTIGNSVTTIRYGAFYKCNSLTSVTIGNSVTTIGKYAFSGCYRLVEVYNKSSLNITVGSSDYGCVGYYAKAVYTEPYTSQLSTDKNGYIIYTDGDVVSLIGYDEEKTDLTLPSNITEINQYAFYYCSSLTSVTIGNSVTSIGEYAFYYCDGLTSVTIGNSVTSIGNSAFYNCRRLTSITFQGTMEQWNAITKGSSWKYNVPASEVVCTDGTVAL